MTVSVSNLDDLSRLFYAEIRTQYGQLYCKSSYVATRYGLKRQFLDTREFDIMDEKMFPVCFC